MSILYQNPRRTNVIWSFDSKCFGEKAISLIKDEEVDALRLVSETGEMSGIINFAKQLRSVRPANAKPIPLMIDMLSKTRGMISGLGEPREIGFGETIKFSQPGGDGDFFIDTDEWDNLFREDASVFLGRGLVMLKVKELHAGVVHLTVVQGGMVYPGAEIHVPKTRTAVRFSDIDPNELAAICELGIDFLVTPGFETPEDLEKLQKQLEQYELKAPWSILKINSLSVYERLEELLPYVRGVLISRVELAMSMDPARIPMMTKEITQLCNDHAKVVFVASEILGSMRHNATPTRAEVSDIANAVLDGADGVVLSEDLAYGTYAARGLMLAKRTVEDVEAGEESHPLNWMKAKPKVTDELEAVTFAAYRTAIRNKAKAIVCITKQGNTALLLSSFRASIPIIGLTMSPEVVRRLSLVRGVDGMLMSEMPNIDQIFPLINDMLIQNSWLSSGDKIIFVSVTISSIGQEASNLFTIQMLT